MATAVMDLVTQAIYERLRGNAQAVEVVPPKQLPTFSPRNDQIVVTPLDAERDEVHDCQGNPPGIAYAKQYIIRCFILQSEDDTRPLSQVLSEFSARVVKTITSATDWHRWGGNALNSQMGGITEFIADDASLAAHDITLTVQYRVSESDPYTQR